MINFKKRTTPKKGTLYLFLIVGLILLFSGLRLSQKAYSKLTNTLETTGTVTGYYESISHSGGGNKPLFAPIVEFSADNKKVKFTSTVSSSWRSYDINEQVPVIYYQNDPERATIKDFQNLWLFPIGLSAFGLISILASILNLRKTEKVL